LFENNLVDLMNKGVDMKNLFESGLLKNDFYMDEWPAISADTNKIFSNIHKIEMDKKRDLNFDTTSEKVFKIKYNVNLLASMSEDNGKIISAIVNSDELEIFKTEFVIDLIDFKWQQFAQKSHLIGAAFHFMYLSFMMAFIIEVFLNS
jgi:hypothetical protein